MKKKAQMQLSFGMIFTILLIISFVAFVIYIIIHFIGFSEKVKVEQFEKELQEHVDGIWRGVQGSKQIKLGLPSKVERVCFIDTSSEAKGREEERYNNIKAFIENENLIYLPENSAEGKYGTKIKNINLNTTTFNENPFCVSVKNGKISLTLKMSYGEKLVTITEE